MTGGFILSLRGSLQYKPGNYHVQQPAVSILIPAHNEEIVIEETLKAMVNLQYPKERLEIIVVNDNSSDSTGIIAERYAARYPFIKVYHTTPPLGGRGKSAALNYGLKRSTGEIIVVYDADNTPEPDAVQKLVHVLQQDQKAGVSVGQFRVINAGKNLLTRFINIETITFQWLAQAGRWYWFKLSTIPGTNFAIRRSILEKLGGWDEKALAEDTELTIRVYELGFLVRFFPAAVTWEQEPESWRVWWKQRSRWVCGNLYVIGKYLAVFNKLKNKKILIDLLYFFLTYFLFIGGVLTSHCLLVMNIFTDIGLKIGLVSHVLLLVGYLLFVAEALLALSLVKNQLTVKNFLAISIMFFLYSQFWLLLVVNGFYLEIKRLVFQQELKWYKTKRFKTDKAFGTKDGLS